MYLFLNTKRSFGLGNQNRNLHWRSKRRQLAKILIIMSDNVPQISVQGINERQSTQLSQNIQRPLNGTHCWGPYPFEAKHYYWKNCYYIMTAGYSG